jgi:hypothetical protein
MRSQRTQSPSLLHSPSFGLPGSWNLQGGSSFGPEVAVGFTPIQNWLEIEAKCNAALHPSHNRIGY